MCTVSECYELLLYSPITHRLFNDIATDHVHEFWSNSDFIFCKIFDYFCDETNKGNVVGQENRFVITEMI